MKGGERAKDHLTCLTPFLTPGWSFDKRWGWQEVGRENDNKIDLENLRISGGWCSVQAGRSLGKPQAGQRKASLAGYPLT